MNQILFSECWKGLLEGKQREFWVYLKFNSSVTCAENSEHSVHPLTRKKRFKRGSSEGIDEWKYEITVREAAGLVVISSGPIRSILWDKPNVHCTAAKFVLCIFRKQQQEEIHIKVCQGRQGKLRIPFKENRRWSVDWHSTDTKLQSSDSNSSTTPNIPYMQNSSLKCKEDAHSFSNIHDPVHYKAFPQRQSVTRHYRYDILQHLPQMWQERPEHWIPGLDSPPRQCTLPCLCVNFWLQRKWPSFYTLHTHKI